MEGRGKLVKVGARSTASPTQANDGRRSGTEWNSSLPQRADTVLFIDGGDRWVTAGERRLPAERTPAEDPGHARRLPDFGEAGMVFAVEETVSIRCPFCGQSCEVAVDTGVTEQRFVTDCEVCCRPFEVFVACDGAEVVRVEARAE